MAEDTVSYPLGITGHRRLWKDVRVQALIDAAIQEIQICAEGKPLVGFSALAEGADRWVVQRLITFPNASFTAVLPMPAELYRADFSNSQSQDEFKWLMHLANEVVELPAWPDRKISYLEASRFILGKVNVLIAVWDGHPARGIGGTGQVVAEARQLEIPVAWIRPAYGVYAPELYLERFSQ
jgi:hypothetical protein